MLYNLWSLGFLVGLAFLPAVVDASLGMGYGFTITPLLLLLGYNPVQAVPAVLLSSVVGNLLSSFFHHQLQNVDFGVKSRSFKIAVLMGGLGSIGSLFGALVATGISKMYLSLYIGIMVIGVGCFILLSRKMAITFSWPKMVAFGLVGAFNKGISGSGFGPIVTTGGLLVGLDAKATVAVQSLAELFASLVGFVTFVLSNVPIDLALTLAMMVGVALASPLAAYIVRKLPGEKLRWLIAVTAIILGASTLLQLGT